MSKPVLPELRWEPTAACSSRNGTRPTLVVVHRWAGGTFDSVVRMFKDTRNEVSSHFVYDGSLTNRCAQMVKVHDKAWTQRSWNPHCVSIECNDRIWLGEDPWGLRVVARMVAKLLHDLDLPAKWVRSGSLIASPKGWCRHADLGFLGGGHTQCPTTHLEVVRQFDGYVRAEIKRGAFRKEWEK